MNATQCDGPGRPGRGPRMGWQGLGDRGRRTVGVRRGRSRDTVLPTRSPAEAGCGDGGVDAGMTTRRAGEQIMLYIAWFIILRYGMLSSVCPSVRPFVGPSVRPSVHPSVRLSVRLFKSSIQHDFARKYCSVFSITASVLAAA